MIEQLGWDPVVRRHRLDHTAKAELNPTTGADLGASTGAATGTSRGMNVAGNVASSGPASEIEKAREAFTAMVLQGFLDAAVPQNISGAGRSGAANTMWRSLLVEQLAKTVAASGQFDVLSGADDARLVGVAGAAPAPPPAAHLIQGKESVNGPSR